MWANSAGASSANRKLDDDGLVLCRTTWTTKATSDRTSLWGYITPNDVLAERQQGITRSATGSWTRSGRNRRHQSRLRTRQELCPSALGITIPFAHTTPIKPTNSKTETLSNLWIPGGREAQ